MIVIMIHDLQILARLIQLLLALLLCDILGCIQFGNGLFVKNMTMKFFCRSFEIDLFI